MAPLPVADLHWPLSTVVEWQIPALYGGAGALALGAVVGLWLILGRGPRLRRGLRRARRLLYQGNWQLALQTLREFQSGRSSPAWEARLRTAEGECHRAAGTASVQAGDFEKGLEQHLRAAELLGLNPVEVRQQVLDAMLTGVRHAFAAAEAGSPDPASTQAIHDIVGRVLILQTDNREAYFWKGLTHLREGNVELAVQSLTQSRGDAQPPTHVDPSLYLGALLLRQGRAKDALRYLTEANRLDPNCPLVTVTLGAAMIEAGGDAQIAVKAMQRALGPRGLLMWAQKPERLWVEGFPEHRSYVRKLASRERFVCPLFGSDVQALVRQGNVALGNGLYRLGQFQESADVFARLAEEAAPSLPILRGLGLALSRLGRYDQAFKHLLTAHELDPQDRLATGHLALCSARGKPAQPEDKVRNVQWAVRTVSKITSYGDREWTELLAKIFAEARALDLPLTAEEHLHLCDHLASLYSTDAGAAEAYLHLAGSRPEAVRSEHAWLYCRAATLHGAGGPQALDLFARTFGEHDQAAAFYTARGWDFGEVEYAYLARAAADRPGQFPAVFGPDYPPRGETFLLGRSLELEQAGKADAALAAAEVLCRLAPDSPRTLDRLARLQYQRGRAEDATVLLERWRALEPANYLPRVRLAVVQGQLGQTGPCLDSVRAALGLTSGRARAEVAFLGARLALSAMRKQAGERPLTEDELSPAIALLGECLNDEPSHPQALWVLAAVRSLLKDRPALGAQAPEMTGEDVADVRFHYLAAVCRLAAGDADAALVSCRRAAADPALAGETAYLTGWAQIYKRDPTAAAEAFRHALKGGEGPSAAHARALLGVIRFHQGAFEEAVYWWRQVPAERRSAWGFDEALKQTTFLAALAAYQQGRYEQAAERMREAGKLGVRDRRLGQLLTLALVKAGQKLLYK